MNARRKAIERLLVEATSNNPRNINEGSVRLHADGLIDWNERTRAGLVARTGLVHWPIFWDLIDEALSAS